jgi:hypothetical protein
MRWISHWPRGDKLALIGLLLTLVGTMAAVLAIPGLLDRKPNERKAVNSVPPAKTAPIDSARDLLPDERETRPPGIQRAPQVLPRAPRANAHPEPSAGSKETGRMHRVMFVHPHRHESADWFVDGKMASPEQQLPGYTTLIIPEGPHTITAVKGERECKKHMTVHSDLRDVSICSE